MQFNKFRLAASALAIGCACFAAADTYGNTNPFETQSSHSPNYVLGVQVVIPVSLNLQSFGMIYGLTGSPLISNAIFGLYSSDPNTGDPLNLMAVTNPINLNAAQTYDHIGFTTTPNIVAGTYWMMACYESQANPRISLLDNNSVVAYWSNQYSNGMPGTAPGVTRYKGQNFNYWVNGNPVPEPTTLAAFGLGAIALVSRRRRRR